MDEVLKNLAESASHIIEAVITWWLIEKIKEHKKQQKKKPSKRKRKNQS